MQRAKVALSDGQCVELRVVLQAKFVSVCEKWFKKLVMTCFFIFALQLKLS